MRNKRNSINRAIAGLCVGMIVSMTMLSGCGAGNTGSAAEVTTGSVSQVTEQSVEKNETQTEAPQAGTEPVTAEIVKEAPSVDETEAQKEALRQEFLAKANEVVVSDEAVTFIDASSEGNVVTIAKNPQKVVNLYGSFTTLWYEAGGSVIGCIGGKSTTALYEEYIGRDITAEEGVTVVAESASGKKWDTETIIGLQPDLIICSTAMSGYATIEAPARAAGIPVVVVNYDDFSDYLKWFKVFCNLNNQPELWEEVAMKSLEEVVTALTECPQEGPTVFSMFAGSESLQANTSNTVVGAMITAMNAKNIVESWNDTTGAERLDINMETVYMANSDIIVIQCHAGAEAAQQQVAETYGNDPVWQSLKAVQEGRVFYLEKELFHNKPNSRFAEAYQKLAEILYSETASVEK